ncbi:MAG: hypothetical protein JW725_02650 [Candidatus Babeliaceae bacterium]|nr:hypothetical protein [Candidatus Babeliaceae bacterium]
MNFIDDSTLPELPTFSEEFVNECTCSKDFRPILFEWYKFVGIFCNIVACISPESPALREIHPVHYAVLIGSLNRCSRLMLSNIRLSSTRKHGETTRLIDRSITETAVKILWLCQKDNPDSFTRYLADGLKKDLLLKKQISGNIENRNGNILVIEQRMLKSIKNCIDWSELSEQKINNAKKLPDFATMCEDLGFTEVFYTAIQRMGSHAVHGTWSDLIFNYLRHEDGKRLYSRDHDSDTQDVQFIVVIHVVLDAMKSFLNYVVSDKSAINGFVATIENIDEKIRGIQSLAWSSDFSVGC